MSKAKVDMEQLKLRYPTLQTELRSVLELSNDPRNVRLHDDKNIAAIIESFQKFGQRKPIVVNAKGEVIAGNGGLEAARRMGWDQIAVAPAPDTLQDQQAYAIADNRTAELATWDGPGLAKMLEELSGQSYDLGSTGFSQDEVAKIIAANQEAMDLAGPANAPGAPEAVGLPGPSLGLPEALAQTSIRVVQLFMDGATHAQWEVALRQLSAQLGTRTASDTVVAAVFQAAGISWKPVQPEAPAPTAAAPS